MRTLKFRRIKSQATCTTTGRCHLLHGQWAFLIRWFSVEGSYWRIWKDEQELQGLNPRREVYPSSPASGPGDGRWRNFLWMVGVSVLILKKLLFVCARHREVALDSENTMLSTSGLVVNVFVESMCPFSEEGRWMRTLRIFQWFYKMEECLGIKFGLF